MRLELQKDGEYYLFHYINFVCVTDATGASMSNSESSLLASTKKIDGCLLIDTINLECLLGYPLSENRVYEKYQFTLEDIEKAFQAGRVEDDVDDMDDYDYIPMTASDYAYSVKPRTWWIAEIETIPCSEEECYYNKHNPTQAECYRGCKMIKPFINEKGFINIVSLKTN